MQPVIVTLSCYNDIFTRLWDSIVEHEGDAPVKLVYDGAELLMHDWGCCAMLTMVQGQQPFIFARNVNLAFDAIDPDRGILLVNDDCQLTMPVLAALNRICDENPEIGILSPQIDGGVGNVLQKVQPRESEWYLSQERLAFVCVYIPAKTRKLVGKMDERFAGYGGDDDNYCRRTQAAGLKLAVTPLVSVVHGYGPNGMSTSFDRAIGRAARNKSMHEMMTIERNLQQR